MKRSYWCRALAALMLSAAILSASSLASPRVQVPSGSEQAASQTAAGVAAPPQTDYWSLVFVFILATIIGLGVVARVSRLLHTPLMSLTNAISAIAVVGSLIVTGADYSVEIRLLGAVALFASMTNIVSGFLITDRMLKMFKRDKKEGPR
jgi:NAD(P) transhydrogenase subunit alpha